MNQVRHEQSKWSALLRDTIILDTGSTISGTMMNPDFVTSIRPATKPITMSTNAGTKRLTMAGHVPNFGGVYFDPDQMANIFGFSHLADQYHVKYDSHVEDAFIVHVGDTQAKFSRTPEGLYVYTPTAAFLDRVAVAKRMESPLLRHREFPETLKGASLHQYFDNII